VTDLVVRDARPEEYDDIGALTVASYRSLVGEAYLELLADVSLRADGNQVIVGVLDGRLAGSVTLVPPGGDAEWRETDDPGAGTVRALGVAPDLRGHGVGRALVTDCIERARRAGWSALALGTTEQMRSALPIYLAAGFVRHPDNDRIMRNGEPLLSYRLELTA
jgi:GNAT superfamily N-acetyltransferase